MKRCFNCHCPLEANPDAENEHQHNFGYVPAKKDQVSLCTTCYRMALTRDWLSFRLRGRIGKRLAEKKEA
jgi:hypothetical protein